MAQEAPEMAAADYTAGQPLSARPAGGDRAATSLADAASGAGPVRYPIDLRPDHAPSCDGLCDTMGKTERALDLAATFMHRWGGEPNFDAAIGLHEIRETVDSEALTKAWERAVPIADADHDHPHRRIWFSEMTVEKTTEWSATLGERPPVNRLISEALWCDRYGLRPSTLRYIAGDMRDDGGYWTTHAAWALALARENGCIDDAAFEASARPIVDELLAHQPATLEPTSAAEVDLFAERLLGLTLLGYRGPETDRSAEVLVSLQRPDGSWGRPTADENPYFTFHAALVSSWALAEWVRSRSAD